MPAFTKSVRAATAPRLISETAAQFDSVLRANLHTTFMVAMAEKDRMLELGFGRIVNISSSGAFRVSPNAAKAGVIALTKGWAQAWGRKNIRVNCIAPGVIDTEANAGVDPAFIEKLRQDTPLGRIGEPREVADATAFMLSEASSFIDGQTLVVCGGRVMLP